MTAKYDDDDLTLESLRRISEASADDVYDSSPWGRMIETIDGPATVHCQPSEEATVGESQLDSESEAELQAAIGDLDAKAKTATDLWDEAKAEATHLRGWVDGLVDGLEVESQLSSMEPASHLHPASDAGIKRSTRRDHTSAAHHGRIAGEEGIKPVLTICLSTGAWNCEGECDVHLSRLNEALHDGPPPRCAHGIALEKAVADTYKGAYKVAALRYVGGDDNELL